MPGKKVELPEEFDLSAPDVISIAEETWELVKIQGMKGFFVVPKIIEVVTRIVYAALKADFDLRGLFGGDSEDFDFFSNLKPDNLLAIPYVMETLDKYKVVISNEILPALLSRDAAWLMNNGTPSEIAVALWKAFRWHAPSIFGEKPWNALKKLATDQEETVEKDQKETEVAQEE